MVLVLSAGCAKEGLDDDFGDGAVVKRDAAVADAGAGDASTRR
jgi:hypothetical protein